MCAVQNMCLPEPWKSLKFGNLKIDCCRFWRAVEMLAHLWWASACRLSCDDRVLFKPRRVHQTDEPHSNTCDRAAVDWAHREIFLTLSRSEPPSPLCRMSPLVPTLKRRAVLTREHSHYAKHLKITTLHRLTHAQTRTEHQLSCQTRCRE